MAESTTVGAIAGLVSAIAVTLITRGCDVLQGLQDDAHAPEKLTRQLSVEKAKINLQTTADIEKMREQAKLDIQKMQEQAKLDAGRSQQDRKRAAATPTP